MSAEIVTMVGGFATLLAAGGSFALFLLKIFSRLEADHRHLASQISDVRERLARIEGHLGIGVPAPGE